VVSSATQRELVEEAHAGGAMFYWDDDSVTAQAHAHFKPHSIAELLARARRIEQERRVMIGSLVAVAALLFAWAAR
jgi:hypothetical protein